MNSRGLSSSHPQQLKLQNANPCEFTRFRPLRLSKYQAPGRLQNTNPREFTRFKLLRPSKYQAPGRLQNATPREFTRFRPLRSISKSPKHEKPKLGAQTLSKPSCFHGERALWAQITPKKLNAPHKKAGVGMQIELHIFERMYIAPKEHKQIPKT